MFCVIYLTYMFNTFIFMGFPGDTVVKNLLPIVGDIRDVGLIPGSGRSPGEGNGNTLWYSCLENPMDRRAWWAKVHRVTELDMTKHTNTHFYIYTHVYKYTRGSLTNRWKEEKLKAKAKALLSDQCKEREKNSRIGKTRDLFKKIRDTKETFDPKMGTIKGRSGMDLTEAEDIKKRWQEYTEEL